MPRRLDPQGADIYIYIYDLEGATVDYLLNQAPHGRFVPVRFWRHRVRPAGSTAASSAARNVAAITARSVIFASTSASFIAARSAQARVRAADVAVPTSSTRPPPVTGRSAVGREHASAATPRQY